ncbi:alpha/beta-hydrolase [Trichodelitschia bisporula]|uniref:Alpha/beta-hydrolase n=1 Tax=Trichodelitschia bisporula TaxID=703511 RepID=A0A6G1HI81_9PEZI|nr:alpha/beta-hydrolase [Trichodelitschia bisporula]
MTFSLGCNSEYNINLLPPSVSVYPKKASGDAPYSTPEGTLRRAIQIPAGFTYGRKQPVILVPGTGTKGCLTFTGNFIKLLSGTSYADPVWLNIPHFLLDDVQTNAEYVAYAINYISAISGKKNVAVIGWSQGNILSQWALKYWPSTRSVVSDLISMSPDFHGSAGSTLLCVDGCAPAIIQQDYNSQLIAALRSNGGDSGYVPTTSIYSAADQVVQPQSGTGASAYLKDARNVGVTNNELQVICPNVGNVTHEGVLYNGLAVALALDALQNAGPGQTSRLNLNTVCNQTAAPGLTLADIVSTENTIPIATIAIMLYPNKVIAEPALMAYAST